MGTAVFYINGLMTPAVKFHNFYLPKFPSAALSSIAVALATTHSAALQMEIYSARFNRRVNSIASLKNQ